jgi:hypothetical protein
MDKYSVDRIEENIIVLENIENKEIIEINKSELDFEVVDGNILKLVDGKFELDQEVEVSRKESLRDRLNRLKNR